MKNKINYDDMPVPGVIYAAVNYRGNVLIVEDSKVLYTVPNDEVVKNVTKVLEANDESTAILTDLTSILTLAKERKAVYDKAEL